jgi:multidrug efflux pump subunit AcrA (membrane-fusion protein)
VLNTKDDGKYVSVIDPDDQSDLIEKKIVTGLRGSDGNVEIISGLNEGDRVVSSL